MSLPLLRPRVSDLVFQLYGRPLHPELFEILAQKRVEGPGCQLAVWITRTGHVITWENAEVRLTEVAAAANEPLPEKRRLLSCRLNGEHQRSLACAHGIHYETTFQVEVLPPEIFFHLHDEIVTDGLKRGLLHHFSPNHRLALAPLGFVTAEARTGCVVLNTFHTFPDEYTIVKSQSLIEKRHHT